MLSTIKSRFQSGKIIWILILPVILNLTVSAQINLVPNPGFEDTLNCGIPVYHAKNWFNPTISTPDYYTSIPGCGKNWTTLPINRTPRTGIAFAGLFCWDGIGQRDYLETILNDTLKAGVKYRVSFYVVRSFDSFYATDKIGACFTVDSLLSVNAFNIPALPQVYSTSGIIYDTSNWVLVSGSFIAQGGEKYLTIGNFFDNQNCSVDSGNGNFLAGYYYFEDVTVVEDTTTGINDADECLKLFIGGNKLIIKAECNGHIMSEFVLTIYDAKGRIISTHKFKSFHANLEINVEHIVNAKGIYLLNISGSKFTKSIKLNILKN